MPPRGLPGNANLEQLKNGAKSFRRAVRAGDGGATEVVREFHPRLGDAMPGSPGLAAFSHADALLVVARSFGFASWAKLKAHVELIAPLTRSPHAVGPSESAADEFLRLACLTYGDDEPAGWDEAERVLAAAPELAVANLATMAAVGAVGAARELLGRDPASVRAPLGPHRWPPLLYLTYSRVPAPAAYETAELLLDHGADPNAGYLREGLCPPFTALTGAFGGGTNPAHPDGLRIARLLLERGADPNDGQTIYNMGDSADDQWLELLLEFGLGRGDGGPWRRLLGERQDSPQEMLEAALMAAAAHGLTDRLRLLLDHGADPNRCDPECDATPAGWAEHHGQADAQHLLTPHEARTQETIATELAYRPDDPVTVSVAHRAQRTSVSDRGAAVQRAGKPAGWLTVAEQLERERDVNITRQGVVWLPVVAAGPGEQALIERIAEASLALYEDLLELGS